MKISNFRVNKFNVKEVVELINKHTEGKNVHGVFFNNDGILNGNLEIYTTEIKTVVIGSEKKKISVKDKYKSHEKKKSKYRGVYWDQLSGKWRSRIMVNGKRISLGVYDDEEEAAKVYDYQAMNSLGSGAKTNFKWQLFFNEDYNFSHAKFMGVK